MTKKEAQDSRTSPIRVALERSDKFVERCLVALYARQTNTEQQTESTTDSNGIGFSGVDAKFGSSLAQQIMRNKYGKPEGERLTFKQVKYARRMALKYTAQLADHADDVQKAKAAKPIKVALYDEQRAEAEREQQATQQI